jgi:CRP-like cAMP-binding protein
VASAQDTGPLEILSLFSRIPKKDLKALSRFLITEHYKNGKLIFEEGSRGDSLYFISSGRISIAKRSGKTSFKEMASLGPGDWFGEVALLSASKRSARATAVGDTVLVKLGRPALNRWLKTHPKLAVGFLLEMARVQSVRLSRTSAEFALLYQLSRLLLDSAPTANDLMVRALPHLVDNWEGRWSGAAYIYNQFNDDLDLAASRGDADFSAIAAGASKSPESALSWAQGATLSVPLCAKGRFFGVLFLRAASPVPARQKEPIERTLEAAAPLLCSALENIGFHAEETMRARLKKSAYGSEL